MIKKLSTVVLFIFFSFTAFSQTKKVAEKKLVKTLENNKKTDVVFSSEIDLTGLKIQKNNLIMLPLFSQSKIFLYADFDINFINERINHTEKRIFNVKIKPKDIKQKTYRLTDIEGIESVSEYKNRLEKERKENTLKHPVQVVSPILENITDSEKNWLGGQIQGKIKSNLQDYLGMKIVVDSKSESALKKIQSESESESHDEDTAIEIGKITTAKFALFSKIRKTNNGYSITAEFTDLTTGEQLANAITKEYIKSGYLYGSTGAVDELTILLADKLDINLTDEQKGALKNGAGSLTIDAQLALATQNEQQYKHLMNQYDEQLRELSVSTELNTEENKRKIEAEKAMLEEKQRTEEKWRVELENQKQKAITDEELESQRSIELKTRRDALAKQASIKAAEIRKLTIEKQGVLGEIGVIENKKKTLIEIRQSAEQRCNELHEQYTKNKAVAEEEIRNKPYTSVELENGKPSKSALQRRDNQISAANKTLYDKFIRDSESVKKTIEPQENALLAEIRADQKNLEKSRTVSSLGEELKVTYGNFSGENKGWVAYISLYSEGVLLYNGNFVLSYDSLVGKKAPDIATELNDEVINEYSNNVDMYSSLFARGTPLLRFELDYNVKAKTDDKPSEYGFEFNTIRVINVTTGKVVQTSILTRKGGPRAINGKPVQQQNLRVIINRTMKPEQDIRIFAGIVEKEKVLVEKNELSVEFFMVKLNKDKDSAEVDLQEKKNKMERNKKIRELCKANGIDMVIIPEKDYEILKTEVTQKLFFKIVGKNPSSFKSDNNPVENVSWYDAVYFCDKLSAYLGLEPRYTVNGVTDVAKWNYDPCIGDYIEGDIQVSWGADGFRLPSEKEWYFAALGGKNYQYSGSDNLGEVGWYANNSNQRSHPVAMKKPNDYGLYDMSGNVGEWIDDYDYVDHTSVPSVGTYENCSGGSWNRKEIDCRIGISNGLYYEFQAKNYWQQNDIGFRIVRTIKE